MIDAMMGQLIEASMQGLVRTKDILAAKEALDTFEPLASGSRVPNTPLSYHDNALGSILEDENRASIAEAKDE